MYEYVNTTLLIAQRKGWEIVRGKGWDEGEGKVSCLGSKSAGSRKHTACEIAALRYIPEAVQQLTGSYPRNASGIQLDLY